MNDLDKINKLFKVITESPDYLEIKTTFGNKTIDYTMAGAVPCFIYEDGLYVVSLDQNIGHGELVNDILDSEMKKEDVAIIHNFGDRYLQMIRDYAEARIWPNQKVFSTWALHHPKYIESTINALKAAGQDPTKYVYDTKDHPYNEGEALSYDEYINYKMSIDDMYKQADFDKRREEDKKLMAQVKMGDFRTSRDQDHRDFTKKLMADKFRKQPGEDLFKKFYGRSGD